MKGMTSSPSRQPKGIPVGGQFATAAHSESGVLLAPPTPPRDGLDVETVVAAAADSIGPGIIPELERQIAETKTPGGLQLMLQSIDSRYNRDSLYERVSSMSGLDAQRADHLAELGYTNVDQLSHSKLRNLEGISSIVRHDIEPDRLAFIGRLNKGQYQWSQWEREAILTAPVADLDNLIADNKGKTPEEKYIATVALLDPEKVDRAQQAFAAGIKPTELRLVEAKQHAPELLVELRNELPESKRGAYFIVDMADRGITGAHVKSYGVKACGAFSGAELDACGIKPAVLRSLVSSPLQTDLHSYRKLSEAGYTKGADLKAASDAMGTTDIRVLAGVRKYADGATLQAFAGALGTSLTKFDAQAVARLGKAGITEPAQLRPWISANHAEANKFIERGAVLGIHADVVTARISPERIGEMTRAGIPVNEAPALKNAPDLWAAGKPFRERWEADQSRLAEQRWIREAKPWAFTEDTYLDGGQR
jgi:hypothetical protein